MGLRIISAISLSLLALLLFWQQQGTATADSNFAGAPGISNQEKAQINLASTSSPLPVTQTSGPTFDEALDEAETGEKERYTTLLNLAEKALSNSQQNPGNLQQTLKSIKGYCASLYNCDNFIEDLLHQYPDQAFARLVQNILSRWPSYQESMANTIMDTNRSARDKFEIIRQIRQDELGAEESTHLFGQQEAWSDMQISIGEFIRNEAENLTSEERLQRLQEIRQASMRPFEQTLKSQESEYDRYQQELSVLTAGKEESEVREITHALRVLHFGEEKAGSMMQRDQQVRDQKQQIDLYWEAVATMEQEIAAQKQQLHKEDWEQLRQDRLREIRLEVFGEN